MNSSRVWRKNNAAKKKVRPGYKPKIRWELFGLSAPNAQESLTSIDAIRREVSALASEGIGQDTRARLADRDRKTSGRSRRSGAGHSPGRGKSE